MGGYIISGLAASHSRKMPAELTASASPCQAAMPYRAYESRFWHRLVPRGGCPFTIRLSFLASPRPVPLTAGVAEEATHAPCAFYVKIFVLVFNFGSRVDQSAMRAPLFARNREKGTWAWPCDLFRSLSPLSGRSLADLRLGARLALQGCRHVFQIWKLL